MLKDIYDIIIALLQLICRRRSRIRALYHVVWQKSSKLHHEEILRERPFRRYYYHIPQLGTIINSLIHNNNVLIVGPPLSGKSRAVYEALKRLKPISNVLIPRCNDIIIESFALPKPFAFWRQKILVIDDLHRFAQRQNLEYLLELTRKKDLVILATCRSGEEFEKARISLLKRNIILEAIFRSSIISIDKITKEVAMHIADKVSVPWDAVQFDGTIGSIFMPLSEIQLRYSECTDQEKLILKGIKFLYYCGIHENDYMIPVLWVKQVSRKYALELEDIQWARCFNNLKNKELIVLIRDRVWIEEVYLEDIIGLELEKPNLTLLREMLGIFVGYPNALLGLAGKMLDLATIKKEKAGFIKSAIEAYGFILQSRSVRHSLMYYIAQGNLANAFAMLAEEEDAVHNCKRAITTYQNGLDSFALREFPIYYGLNEMGIAAVYTTLAGIEDTVENCGKALEKYDSALKIFSKPYMFQYWEIQMNIGVTCRILADKVDKVKNCSRAINIFENAIRFLSHDNFPAFYAMILSNLGCTYMALAQLENKVRNSKLAISTLEKALDIYDMERFPLKCATTFLNLGVAYGILAEEEERVFNFTKSIKLSQIALRVFNLEHTPREYAVAQKNIGYAYLNIKVGGEELFNLQRAVRSFEEALKVFNARSYKSDYEKVSTFLGIAYLGIGERTKNASCFKKSISIFKRNLALPLLDRALCFSNFDCLATAYRELALLENASKNCKMSIEIYKRALNTLKFNGFSGEFAILQKGLATSTLMVSRDLVVNSQCDQAIDICKESLNVLQLDIQYEIYASIQISLGIAYLRKAELERRAENCRDAISCFTNAVKTFYRKRKQEDYGVALNNLGAAYCMLYEIEQDIDICRRAIKFYKKASIFFNTTNKKIQYAETLVNIASLYAEVSKHCGKAIYCKKAIWSARNAVKIFREGNAEDKVLEAENGLKEILSICNSE